MRKEGGKNSGVDAPSFYPALEIGNSCCAASVSSVRGIAIPFPPTGLSEIRMQ